MPPTERGRFAPSPSGALHLGSARTALASALAARRFGAGRGAFVLRVEDLDTPRVAPGATDAMLRDLGWLGVRWDEGPDTGGPSAPYLQSARRPLYDAALAALRDAGWVYPCACSRREVELAAQAPHGAEPVYPGTCRGRDPHEVVAEARTRGRGVAWRFAVPDEPEARVVRVRDLVAGPYAQDVGAEVGDFVVFRADGVPAYQLAVVVDDIAMGITEIVRGADLLASAPRQVLLYRALGAEPPRWAHIPLVVGDDGARLAKRHGSISLAELRARGTDPHTLRAALCRSLGVAEGQGSVEQMAARFDFANVPREPASLGMLRREIPEVGEP